MPRKEEIVDLTDSPVAQQRPTIDDDSTMLMPPVGVEFGPDNVDLLEDEEEFGQVGDYLFAPWTSLTNLGKSMAPEESLGSTSRASSSSSSSSNSSVAKGSENAKSGQANSSQIIANKNKGKSIIGCNHRRSKKTTTGGNVQSTHTHNRKIKDAKAGNRKKESSNAVKPPNLHQRKNPSSSTKQQLRQNHRSDQVLSGRQTSSGNSTTPILLHHTVTSSRKRKLPDPGHTTSAAATHIDITGDTHTGDTHICKVSSSSSQVGRHIEGKRPKFPMHASRRNANSNASDRKAITNNKSSNNSYQSDASFENNMKINESKDTAFGQDRKGKGKESVIQKEQKISGIREVATGGGWQSEEIASQSTIFQGSAHSQNGSSYESKEKGKRKRNQRRNRQDSQLENYDGKRQSNGSMFHDDIIQDGINLPDYRPGQGLARTAIVSSHQHDDQHQRLRTEKFAASQGQREVHIHHERLHSRRNRNRHGSSRNNNDQLPQMNTHRPAGFSKRWWGAHGKDRHRSSSQEFRNNNEPKALSRTNEPKFNPEFEEEGIVNVDCFGRALRPIKRRQEVQTNASSPPLAFSKSERTNVRCYESVNQQGLCSAKTIGRMKGLTGGPKELLHRFSSDQSPRIVSHADSEVELIEDNDGIDRACDDWPRKRRRLPGVDKNKAEQSIGCEPVDRLGINCIELEDKEERKQDETQNSCDTRGEACIEMEYTTSLCQAQPLVDASHDADVSEKSRVGNEGDRVFESQATENQGRAPTEQGKGTSIDSPSSQCTYPEEAPDTTNSDILGIKAIKYNRKGEGILVENTEDSSWLSPAVEYWVERALKAIAKVNIGKIETKPIENFECSLAAEVKGGKTNKHRPNGLPSADRYVKQVVRALRKDSRLSWGGNKTGIFYWSSTDPPPLPSVQSHQIRLVQERIVKLISNSKKSMLQASSLPELYRQVHMVDLDYKGLGFTKLRTLLDTIPAIRQHTPAQGRLILSVSIEQTDEAIMEGDDLLGTVQGRIVKLVSKNSLLQACNLPGLYRQVHMADLDYKGLGFKKLTNLLDTIPAIRQTHVKGSLVLSTCVSKEQTAEGHTEGSAAQERLESLSILDAGENPQPAVAGKSFSALRRDAEGSPHVAVSQDKTEASEEANCFARHGSDSTRITQSLPDQKKLTSKPYFRDFPASTTTSNHEAVHIDEDDNDACNSTNREDRHIHTPNDDVLDEAPRSFDCGNEIDCAASGTSRSPLRDNEVDFIFKSQVGVLKVEGSDHGASGGRTRSGVVDPGVGSSTTNQNSKVEDFISQAEEFEGSSQPGTRRVTRVDTVRSVDSGSENVVAADRTSSPYFRKSSTSPLSNVEVVDSDDDNTDDSDSSSQSERCETHHSSNRNCADDRENKLLKLSSVSDVKILPVEQQSCKEVESVNPLHLKTSAEASVQQAPKVALKKPRFKPQKPKNINRTRRRTGSNDDKKETDTCRPCKDRISTDDVAAKPPVSSANSENTTAKAGSSNPKPSSGNVKETRYVFHAGVNNKNSDSYQSSRKGPAPRCFDSRSFFTFSVSNEDAEKEQERLFKESAERMKASAARFKTVPNGFDHRLKPTMVSFSEPIRDVEKRYPNHWRFTNLHSRLGLPANASIPLIKKHYRRLALVYHPDKSKNDPDSTLKFQQVTEAYRKLLNA